MKRTKLLIIGINLLLLAGYFMWSVAGKERILTDGKLVLLELAPVDPRSMMQGDYMRLSYKINRVADSVMPEKRGYCILKLNPHGVGELIRLQKKILPLQAGNIPVKYFYTGSNFFKSISIGSSSYFFKEGTGKKYEQAKFGGLRVDANGNSVLVGLYDKELKLIK